MRKKGSKRHKAIFFLFLVFIAGFLLSSNYNKLTSAVVSPTAAVTASSTITIPNAGFEQGSGVDAYYWLESKNQNRTSSKFHSGSYSLLAQFATPRYAGEASISSPITVEPNTNYTLGGYIWNWFAQGQAYLDVKAYRGPNDPLWSCDARSVLDSCGWQYVSCDFITPADVTQVQVRTITDKYPWGMAWFDDIEITKNEPDSCVDSDNGKDISILGTVSGYYREIPYTYTDYCVSSRTLEEYYCSGVYKASSGFDCDIQLSGGICENGICTTTTTTTTTTTLRPGTIFYDDFETDLNKWTVLGGIPSLSSAQANSPTKSVLLPTGESIIAIDTRTCCGSETFIDNGIIELYFFDDLITDRSIIDLATWQGGGNAVELGINTQSSGYYQTADLDHYIVKIASPTSVSNVSRTYGWHKAEIELVNYYTRIYVDDILIKEASLNSGYPIHQVILINRGSYSDYFDDVTIIQTVPTAAPPPAAPAAPKTNSSL